MICDTDLDHLFKLEGELRNYDYDVINITDASELISSVIRLRPAIVIVNPDMRDFNEYGICKHIKKDLDIPVIYLLDKHSTHRADLDDCQADDILTKPVEVSSLVHLVEKHIATHQA